jgi:predicted nucleic acid-binding protein
VAVDSAPVVVDTNIVFSALISRNSRFRDVLWGSSSRFFICETVVVELFRHKEKLLRANRRLPATEFEALYHGFLRRVEMFKEDWVSGEHWAAAIDLCRDVDPADSPHVAITLALDGLLWTGDRELRKGLEGKGFNRFFTP